MNIILIHGDYSIKSYARLLKFLEVAKERGWEISWFDKDKNLAFLEIATNAGLFSKNKIIVVRGFSSLNSKDLEWLKEKNEYIETTLVIYEDGELPRAKIAKLPKNTKLEEFKLPKIIFKFLESLYPGNSKNSLQIFCDLIKREPPEFIFSLCAKTFRDLYWIKVSPETLPYPSWRLSKLRKQSSYYSLPKLSHIINNLAKIDIKVKTSEANVEDSLDHLIITQLE
jgi:DNA polymerase III delta subunit